MLQALSLSMKFAGLFASASPGVDGASNAIAIIVLSNGARLPTLSSCSISDPFTFDIPIGPVARKRLRRCKCSMGEALRPRFAPCTRLRSTPSNPISERRRATGYLPSCPAPTIFPLRRPWLPPTAQPLSSHEDSGCCRDAASHSSTVHRTISSKEERHDKIIHAAFFREVCGTLRRACIDMFHEQSR